MPIYPYRCQSCGFEQDVLQKISDAPLSVCPSCQKAEFKKQLSAPGFQLKGSGWYQTDFRNNGSAKSTPASNGPSGGGESGAGGGEGGADSKPEAAAATACNPGCACH